MKFRFSLSFAILLLGGQVFGQYGLGANALPGSVGASVQNPANMALGDFESFRIGSYFNGWAGNSDAPLKGMLGDESGYVSMETRDRFLNKLNGRVGLGAGYNWDLANAQVRLGQGVLGVSLSDELNFSGQINNPQTLGLLLKGNGAYQGVTISDEDVFISFQHVRSLGLGYALDMDGIRLGGKVKFLQGLNFADANISQYSMTTDTLGTRVQLAGDYSFSKSPDMSPSAFDFQGLGAALDLGVSMDLGDRATADFSINNLGFVSWKSQTYSSQVDLDWEGVNISSFFADDLPTQVQETVDSLENIILPDSTEGNNGMVTGAVFRAGFHYSIGENGNLSAQLAWSPLKTGPWSGAPVLGIVYRHQLAEGFNLGLTAFGGGQQSYGAGLLADYQLSLGTSAVRISAGADNLLGLVGAGTGISAFGGVSFIH